MLIGKLKKRSESKDKVMSEKEKNTQNINVVVQTKGPRLGFVGLIVGFVGIFAFSIVLSPLAFILGLIALFSGQIFSGLFSMLFGILGLLTSPVFLGLLGMSALISIPFLDPAFLQSLFGGM
jgi:hypothetical protein